MPSELAGIRLALVDLGLTDPARVPRMTVAGEAVVPVDALAPVTRRRQTVIDVRLTRHTCIARGTFACVSSYRVVARAAITARTRRAVVDVDLTTSPREPNNAGTSKGVDHIVTNSSIQTRVVSAFVDFNLALSSRETRHADASERARVVQAGAVVPTWVTLALIDVCLAAGSGETDRAVTGEGARGVDADPVVLARRTLFALVDVLGAVQTFVSGGAGARVGAVDGACVTYGVRVTRIRSASVVQVTQETRLPGSTFAVECAHSVDTRSSIEASSAGAIIYIDRTLGAGPAIDANAGESAH